MRSLVSLMLMGALIWPGVVGAHAQGEQRPIDWYAVRCSRPGDELLITARGGRPIVRYFLQADDASITVLNLASPPLPWRAARALRDLASKDPGQFEHFRSPGFERQLAHSDLRLSSEGLFAGDQKLADLDTFVETIARDRLIAVKTTYHLPRGATIAIASTVVAVVGILLLQAWCNGACIGR